jgi:excisionase family DNA binding protein
MKKNLKFYTVNGLAKLLGCHYNTILNNIRCGRINAFRIGMGKRASLRIYEQEVKRMIEVDAKKTIDAEVEKRVAEELAKRKV